MQQFLSYWFYPRPGATSYENPKVLLLLFFCILLFLGSFGISLLRKKRENPVTKKLMRSWAPTMRWLGGVGILLVISRAEDIQFLSIRAFWVLWVAWGVLFVIFQAWKFRLKHYTILPKEYVEDPRDKYLPKKT
jgi:cell division protein FtsW (lipid II flippase)